MTDRHGLLGTTGAANTAAFAGGHDGARLFPLFGVLNTDGVKGTEGFTKPASETTGRINLRDSRKNSDVTFSHSRGGARHGCPGLGNRLTDVFWKVWHAGKK